MLAGLGSKPPSSAKDQPRRSNGQEIMASKAQKRDELINDLQQKGELEVTVKAQTKKCRRMKLNCQSMRGNLKR